MVTRFFLLLVVIFASCSMQTEAKEDVLDVAILDVFVNLQEVDNSGKKNSLEQLQLIVKFENRSSNNYYLEFDDWMKERANELSFYIRSECNDDKSFDLNLAYVTSPTLYLQSGEVDTIALKCNFKEVRVYVDQCVGQSSEELIKERLKTRSMLDYKMEAEFSRVEKGGRVYFPISNFNVVL